MTNPNPISGPTYAPCSDFSHRTGEPLDTVIKLIIDTPTQTSPTQLSPPRTPSQLDLSLHRFPPCTSEPSLPCHRTCILMLAQGGAMWEAAYAPKIVSPMTRLPQTRGQDSLLTTKLLFFPRSIRACLIRALGITAIESVA